MDKETRWSKIKAFFSDEWLEKFKIRFSKYLVWILVNFILCLLPIAISAIIAKQIDDNVFISFIAFSYTLIISSLYVFKGIRNSELIDWLTIGSSFVLLVAYILFPNLLPSEANGIIRAGFVNISSIILLVVIVISFFLNFPSIEDQVERVFNERIRQKAETTGNNVKGFMKELKADK